LKSRRAVILINVGTPDNCDVPSVRRYLREFLNDPRVITIPGIVRKILVNGIIVPFRAPKSAAMYKEIWTEKGSPLLHYTNEVTEALAKKAGDQADIFGAMRYGSPSLEMCLEMISSKPYDEIIIFPLYPQYASSTTGSVADLVYRFFSKKAVHPTLHFISTFYSDPGFIDAFVQRISRYDLSSYDHILFSYHGLPVSHVEATHPGKSCEQCGCTETITEQNQFCYHASCYETTRLITNALNLPQERFSTAFQSRFGKRWLSPYSNETLITLAEQGNKRVLVVAPSFVADCLETVQEIGNEFNTLFTDHGGITLDLVEGLNASESWIEYLAEKILTNTSQSRDTINPHLYN